MRTTARKPLKTEMGGRQKFDIDCFPFIFTLEELNILEKKGHILKDLSEGKRAPVTAEEKSFVKSINGTPKDYSTIETAWMKYLNRRKLEAALLQTEEVYKEYRNRFRA